MSQFAGKDPPSLLAHLAPPLPLPQLALPPAPPRPPRLPHRHHAHGQAQAHLRPLDRLRRLRRRHRLRAPPRHGQEARPEDLLLAHHPPGKSQGYQSGEDDGQVGRGGDMRRAVRGMLPKNRLRDDRMARLKCFEGEAHPYKENILSITAADPA